LREFQSWSNRQGIKKEIILMSCAIWIDNTVSSRILGFAEVHWTFSNLFSNCGVQVLLEYCSYRTPESCQCLLIRIHLLVHLGVHLNFVISVVEVVAAQSGRQSISQRLSTIPPSLIFGKMSVLLGYRLETKRRMRSLQDRSDSSCFLFRCVNRVKTFVIPLCTSRARKIGPSCIFDDVILGLSWAGLGHLHQGFYRFLAVAHSR
jgi:hypothetical protein